jgi:predicted transcriptional regulator
LKMRVGELLKELNASAATGEVGLDREVDGVYVCDLLSWVMSHAEKGDLWITVLTNLNVVAVAVLAEVACIVVPEGIPAESATVQRAVQEGVPILCSSLSAYEICCKMQKLIER